MQPVANRDTPVDLPGEQVLLVSHQPIPNIMSVLAAPATHVHLLVSERMELQADRLERFCAGRGVGVSRLGIEPYDFAQVEGTCRSILRDKPPGSVVLNATGGTKVAAMAAFGLFRERGFPSVYFDPEKWRLLRLAEEQHVAVPFPLELGVRDYLALHGLNVVKAQGEDGGVSQRSALSDFLARELPAIPGFIRQLNKVAADSIKAGLFPCSSEMKFVNRESGRVLQELSRSGLAGWDRATRLLTFPTEEAARYLNGFWMEEHSYTVLRKLQPFDLLRNVEVAWDGTGEKPVTNEFDVVFTSGARLFLVSCKTSRMDGTRNALDKGPLYELDALKDVAGGLFGRGILVSASPMGDALRRRARASSISWVDGSGIAKLDVFMKAFVNSTRKEQ